MEELVKSLEELNETAKRLQGHLNQFEIEYRKYLELKQSRIEAEEICKQ